MISLLEVAPAIPIGLVGVFLAVLGGDDLVRYARGAPLPARLAATLGNSFALLFCGVMLIVLAVLAVCEALGQ